MASDDNEHPRRSSLRLFEDGKALGPSHSFHADVRSQGRGRFSHWHKGLLFSASDNSDPRTNGRAYTLAYSEPLPPIGGWLFILAAAVLLLRADLEGRGVPLPRPRMAAARTALREHWMHAALFAALAACAVLLGAERSGWIVATQPFDPKFAANSLLGSSWILDGSVVHRDDYPSLLQVEFLAGEDVTPNARRAFPLQALAALLLAPFAGVVGAIVAVNLAAWAACIWLTQRFTMAFSGDAAAAKWAALFAVPGLGFAIHALDLSEHMVSIAVHAAAVVVVFESRAWERRVPLRTHLGIGALLAIAGLHLAGVILMAAYVLVAIRRNSARDVVVACALAVLLQAAWVLWVAEIFHLRRGAEVASIPAWASAQAAIAEWKATGDIVASMARRARALAGFEMPLTLLAGAAGLAWAIRRAVDRVARAAFVLPFMILPFLAAIVLVPSWTSPAPIVYGTSVFFFTGAGIAAASLVRRREALFAPAAVLVAVLGIAWSTAHFGNILGPAKAYVAGFDGTGPLFLPGAWEVQSITQSDPVPRLFGGQKALSRASLAKVPSLDSARERKSGAYAALATAPLVVITVALIAAVVPLGVPSAAALALLLSLAATLAGQMAWTNVPASPVERVHSIPAGKSLTYQVSTSSELRKRLLAGIEAGGLVTLFPAYYNGEAPPAVTLDGRAVKVAGRYHGGNWALDADDLRAALKTVPGILRVTFPGGEGLSIGGWQAAGAVGRRLTADGQEVGNPTVLPAVELRLVADKRAGVPVLVAF